MVNDGRNKATLFSGLVAIVIGGLFLLEHSGYIHIGNLWRFWPVILILIGIKTMLEPNTKCGRGNIFGGGIALIWGILLLAASFGYLGWAQMWPWFLIGLGLLLLWETYRPKPVRVAVSPASGTLHPESVFSAVQKTISDQDFKAGSASAVFGSVELDFLQANMAADSAVLDVNAVFGSIEVRIPISWNAVIEAGVVFGSSENHARAPLPNAGPPKTLYVRGGAVFGSIEVRN